MAADKILSIENGEGLAQFLLTEKEALHCLFFCAQWDEASKPGGPLDAVLARLAEVHPGVLFGKVRARSARACGARTQTRPFESVHAHPPLFPL
jgi:hypothetical protein